MLDGTTLVLVEVRARGNGSYEDAAFSINATKLKRMKRAALLFAAKNDCVDLRVDAVVVGEDGAEWFENVIDFSET